MKRHNPSIGATFLGNMMVIAAASLGLWCLVWIHDEYAAFREEAARQRVAFTENRKAMLQSEVAHVVEYIDYMIGQTEKRLRTQIRRRVLEAHTLATHLYREYRSTRTPQEIQKMITDALRPLRFNSGRGYFFAFDENGIEKLLAVRPEMEGQNILSVTGAKGKYVVRDMLALVREKDKGFYRYTWFKPDAEKKSHPKVSFVKWFAPYGWVIGAGDYIEDMEAQIQREILERVVDLRFGAEGYFFGSTYGGDPLFSNGEITRGTGSVWDLTDPNGVKIIQEQRRVAMENGSGFVRYAWRKLDSPVPSPKISFVMGIDRWKWIIGAGVYLDTVEAAIAETEAALKARLKTNIFKSVLILVALFSLILIWARHISARVAAGIRTFSDFFGAAATESVPMDPAALHFQEFREMAVSANRMLADRKTALDRLQESEARLRQAHKLEAVGTLAGGIAHDFNNILSIIIGNTDLALLKAPEDSPIHHNLKSIETASFRAKAVVKQLLSFSRTSAAAREPVRLDALVVESVNLLRASLPAAIDIKTEIDDGVSPIEADPTQIHQILINLCTNAAQAMEAGGGALTVGLRETAAPDKSGKPARLVHLSVADTGHGMDGDIQERVFDPYFTTKEVGKGTGLGLAVVHGIVANHGGEVHIDSKTGEGTRVTASFPALEARPAPPPAAPPAVHGGGERILFVDDEPGLAAMSRGLMEHLGYKVAADTDPLAALARFQADPHAFDLVITDLTMPGMTGDRLAGEIRAIRRDIPMVLCSGYADRVTPPLSGSAGGWVPLEKPFDQRDLASAIRQALNGGPAVVDPDPAP